MGNDDTNGLGTSAAGMGLGLGRHDLEPLNDTSKFGGQTNIRDSFDAAFDNAPVDDDDAEDFMVKPKPKRA